MLDNPEEIAIISNARQRNVRDPSRSRAHFDHIFEDFLQEVPWESSKVLDLGPGHYDFGEMARERGATPWAIDNDGAVLDLGRHKGLQVIEGNIRNASFKDVGQRFDGVFCKFAWNAFWYEDEATMESAVKRLDSLLKPNAWAWVAPWNGVPRVDGWSRLRISEHLRCQTRLFRSIGFECYELSTRQAKYYGMHGETADRSLFIRSLEPPKKLRRRKARA